MKNEEGNPIAIDTEIQIGYDGKIVIGEDSSYEQQDNNNYGNILEKPISVLLAEGAFNEPFTEDEAKLHDKIYTCYINKEFDNEDDEELYEYLLHVFECVYYDREKIHQAFPKLNFEEIVDLAYHDINIWIKKTYGLSGDFYRIDNLELFNTSLTESINAINKIKIMYPMEAAICKLLCFGKNVEPIPDKITRERYSKLGK